MEYKGKVSLVGNEKTGKTSLILRYLKNTFTEEYITTLGADFVDKTYTEEDISELGPTDELTLVLWDMAGQAHFHNIAEIYCEGSNGLIIVFDVTNRDSFEALPKWAEFANRVCPGAEKLIVGNKTDLERVITDEEIAKMKKKINIDIELTSAKENLESDSSNVKNVFQKMALRLLNLYMKK